MRRTETPLDEDASKARDKMRKLEVTGVACLQGLQGLQDLQRWPDGVSAGAATELSSRRRQEQDREETHTTALLDICRTASGYINGCVAAWLLSYGCVLFTWYHAWMAA